MRIARSSIALEAEPRVIEMREERSPRGERAEERGEGKGRKVEKAVWETALSSSRREAARILGAPLVFQSLTLKQLTSLISCSLFPSTVSPVLVPRHRHKKARPRAVSNGAGIPSKKMYQWENVRLLARKKNETEKGNVHRTESRKTMNRENQLTMSHGGIVDRGHVNGVPRI